MMRLMPHLRVMRTTVLIDDRLLTAVRERAHTRRQTLSQVVEDALRAELARDVAAQRPSVPVFTAGSGPRPGFDLRSNRAVQVLVDEVGDVDHLR